MLVISSLRRICEELERHTKLVSSGPVVISENFLRRGMLVPVMFPDLKSRCIASQTTNEKTTSSVEICSGESDTNFQARPAS